MLFTGSDRDGWIGAWSPGIGDPTILGWGIVAAYATATVICFRALKHSGKDLARARRAGRTGVIRDVALPPGPRMTQDRSAALVRLWFWLTALVGALGINKQLDFQTAFTEAGRMTIRELGWYGIRRPLQLVFILILGLFAIKAAGRLRRLVKGQPPEALLAAMGALILAVFVVIRAASFHHIDILLGLGLGGLKLNHILELMGISCIGVGAWRYGKNRPSPNVA